MSLLAPLYFLGAAAVALPILFHLIRRTPRGQVAFSSLMFLSPSPPRLTRRSRLDHWLLLLLRAAAVILLALAFARPFLRQAAQLAFDQTPGRRVLVLLDTSASMRRGDLWTQAVRLVRQELARVEDVDDVALWTFDQVLQTRVDFDSEGSRSGREKAQLASRQLAELTPTWYETDLGQAVAAAANALSVANDLRQSQARLQILLVSDLQEGAVLEALQDYEWPAAVALDARAVTPRSAGNATLHIVQSEETLAEHEDALRVRISNTADSKQEQFYLQWAGTDGPGQPLAAQVPAGQNVMVRMQRPADGQPADQLVLRGDDADFDNRAFVVPIEREQFILGYIGDDQADDPEGLLFYLQQAVAHAFRREVHIEQLAADDAQQWNEGASRPMLVVVTQALAPEVELHLREYLEQGGHALLVLQPSRTAVELVGFIPGAQAENQTLPAEDDGYVMLGDIDFSHPLFAPFAKPQYNDFTKIHFWRHTPVRFDESAENRRVLARFDDGSPALWEQEVGKGVIFVLTSGWRPADSQLALSSKFVPLLDGLLDRASGRELSTESYTVGQPLPLPEAELRVVVTRPDGTRVSMAADETVYRGADEPGVYEITWGDHHRRVAVNLSPRESQTTPLNIERLEQLGVVLGTQPAQSEEIERQRQLRDMELESRQQIWQWLVACVLGVLCCETWLAARRSQPTRESAPESDTG